MSQADSRNTTNLSRRRMLGGLGRTAVAGAVALAPLMVVAPTSTSAAPVVDLTPLSRRPLTPAEYLAEMRAIGCRPVAALHNGKPLSAAVIEYGPDDATEFFERAQRRLLIQSRVSVSGDDFWERTSAYLHDQGLSEEVYPQRGREERDRRRAERLAPGAPWLKRCPPMA
jgi:hypothetical protein